jgi:hypothetical protein
LGINALLHQFLLPAEVVKAIFQSGNMIIEKAFLRGNQQSPSEGVEQDGRRKNL